MKNIKLLKIGLIGLSCLTINSWASNIKHVQDTSKYPISSDLISVSRGGTLSDKKAMTNGIKTILIKSITLHDQSYSNKTYNKLLFDIKKDIIDNDKSLDTLITDGIIILGGYHTCGIEQGTGDTYCWEYNYYEQLGLGTNDGNLHSTPQKV